MWAPSCAMWRFAPPWRRWPSGCMNQHQQPHDLPALPGTSGTKPSGIFRCCPCPILTASPTGDVVSRVIGRRGQLRRRTAHGLYPAVYRRDDHSGYAVLSWSRIHCGIALVVVLHYAAVAVGGAFHRHSAPIPCSSSQSETRGEQTGLHRRDDRQSARWCKAFGHEKASMEQFDEINGRLQKCVAAGHFLLVSDQSQHPLRQRRGVCGRGPERRAGRACCPAASPWAASPAS